VAGSILGNRVLRKEDPKFLTTGGVYVDDLNSEPLLVGALHATFVRSTVAHANIVGIDVADALESPGVVAIYTAADLGLEPVAATFNPTAKRTLLASGKVRYVGEPVAVVLTKLANQGEDAAEKVIVDYDTLEVLIDIEQAMTSTTHIYEECGSNVVFDSTAIGMPDNTGDAMFTDCEVVVKGRYVNQRVAPCPLEVRASAAAWDNDGRLVQWMSTQHAQGARDTIQKANGLEAEKIRVITPDVGGGFGAKISAYPEELVLGAVAKKAGLPIRWLETRSESMTALGHGRAQIQYITIGGTKAGKVTAYQLHVLQDSGA
jgi:carbon-monoxide dehydrogenase large subunit